MDRFQLCSKGVGFAVALTATVGLTTTAFAGSGDIPGSGPVLTNADFIAGMTLLGDTSDNTHTLDGTGPGCPNPTGSAPDAWYVLSITASIAVDIDLCASAYDTKVYITTTGLSELFCNDDACPGFRSALTNIALTPGVYYLAVDGFGTESGQYQMEISEFQISTCVLDPACSGDAEGEACDDSGADDTVNGGCNSTPFVTVPITLDGNAICGVDWAANATRDTDWFSFTLASETIVDINLRAETNSISFFVGFPNGLGICTGLTVPGDLAISHECDTVTQTGGDTLAAGDYVVFVGTGNTDGSGIFDGYPCPPPGPSTSNAYEVSITTGTPPPPPCPWDLSGNSVVDFADILLVIGNWGPCPTM